MNRFLRPLATIAVCAVLAGVPASAGAAGAHAPSRAQTTHQLPTGNPAARVFSFGLKGGNIRPWSVVFALDGSVTATGVTAGTQTLGSPQDTLKGLLALADAEGFFAMSKQIGCPGGGNPDVGARTIAISTSAGTKRVSVFGSCKPAFNQLYAVLQQVAGTNR